ncbi:coiled-coil domain-containing protein [Brevibacillus daliensis]|uniref:coiled-coil domain-containing protein n=1 Tax=Brevibacillus daliensis TaxID=2892995 RepID=UPI001E4FD46A|nr:hypothetical protein [Brevibacillus daliensis]
MEHTILQQHLTQLELERNLGILREEEKRINKELATLELEAKRQELTIASSRKHAGKVARAYYMGKRDDLLTLLFNAKDFNQILASMSMMERIFAHDMKKLEKFQGALARSKEIASQKEAQLKQIRELRISYENRLTELLAVKMMKEENLEKLPETSTIEALMKDLVDDWRTRGLPVFRDFFSVLAGVMQDLPELVTSDRIQSEGLFTHKLVITEEEFNQFLLLKNPMFQHAYFTFDDNHLEVVGNYDNVNVKIRGMYKKVSPIELQFQITELIYEGFQLPLSTAEEMTKEYDLGFYPSLINENIRVEEVTLDNHKLEIKIKFDFSKS